MTAKTILGAKMLAALLLTSCNNTNQAKTESSIQDTSTTHLETKNMNSYIAMFEIPASDISRAINFYQNILDITIERMDIEGMKMGILPYEEQIVAGVIIEGEGYIPSANGVTIYLHGGNDLQVILDKLEKHEGKIILPKTAHADESGYFAIFLDSEGNKMALHSPN